MLKMIKRTIFLVIAIFVLSGTVLAISVDLPKTGQTISYSSNDDGALQKGKPAPSPRFADHGDGTVTDNLTGMMWAKDANLPGTARTWQEALDFVIALNSGSGTYGHNDWRLPNRKELRSLVDHSVFKPALTPGHPFVNIQELTTGSDYWTSTTDPYTFEWAWYIDLYDGDNYADPKTLTHWVWPVRGSTTFLPATNQAKCYDSTGNLISCTNTGQDAAIMSGIAWPNPRFTDNGDETITDNFTGLLWTKNANLPGATKAWQQALDYAGAMNTGSGTYGHKDWRLPNVNELDSLVNDDTVNAKKTSTWLGTQGFTNVQEVDYWTSSTDAKVSTDAWRVFMRTGFENAQDKTNSVYYAYVWPVTDSIIPVPASQQSFQYAPAASAAKSTNPSLAKPIGVGSVAAGGTGGGSASGQSLYDQYCASCHGSGSSSNKIGATASRIQTAISQNQGGMGSLSFLTSSQIDSIASYLQSLASGTTSGTTLSLEVSAGKFSGAVDVYLAVYAPDISPDIYMIMPDYSLQPYSTVGLVAYKTNVTAINERLYGDIPTSSLSKGTYYLYMAVTPAGSIASYYLYQTSFVIQ